MTHREIRTTSVAGVAAVALLAMGGVGCSSQAVESDRGRLFFHASVVPSSPTAYPATRGEDDLEFSLKLDGNELSRVVVAKLKENSFADCTGLDYPSDAAAFAEKSKPEQLEHWLSGARENSSDLVITCDVNYSPLVRTEKNDRFWLNLPLFFLGGPATYFISDRTYFVTVGVHTSIYDLDPVRGRVKILEFDSKYRELSLNFLQRARGVTPYALSLICPAGFLAWDNEKVEESIESKVTEALAEEVASQIRAKSEQIDRPSRVPFYVDSATVRVVRRSADTVSFAGDVILKSGGGLDRLRNYRFECGAATPATGDFTDADRAIDETLKTSENERVYRYKLDVGVPVESNASTFRLTISDRSGRSRSYTFPIEQVGGKT